MCMKDNQAFFYIKVATFFFCFWILFGYYYAGKVNQEWIRTFSLLHKLASNLWNEQKTVFLFRVQLVDAVGKFCVLCVIFAQILGKTEKAVNLQPYLYLLDVMFHWTFIVLLSLNTNGQNVT